MGVEIGGVLLEWLGSTSELPVEETVAALGLEWRRKEGATGGTFGADLPFQGAAPERWSGMQVEEIKTGLKVAKVWRDSPAEAAGIGVDDELIAVDGVRVSGTRSWDATMRAAARSQSLTITAASEGRLYQAELRPIPRAAFELVEKSAPTDQERKRLERWLGR